MGLLKIGAISLYIHNTHLYNWIIRVSFVLNIDVHSVRWMFVMLYIRKRNNKHIVPTGYHYRDMAYNELLNRWERERERQKTRARKIVNSEAEI